MSYIQNSESIMLLKFSGEYIQSTFFFLLLWVVLTAFYYWTNLLCEYAWVTRWALSLLWDFSIPKTRSNPEILIKEQEILNHPRQTQRPQQNVGTTSPQYISQKVFRQYMSHKVLTIVFNYLEDFWVATGPQGPQRNVGTTIH